MKNNLKEFFFRGFAACGFGPIVLAVVYLILESNGVVHTVTVREMCVGIFSISALAFVAGGMNFIYKIEKMPLMLAILIHGGVLYASYLATYLINGWLEFGMVPILVYSVIFVVGYLAVWTGIYCVTRKRINKVNMALMQKKREQEK